MKVKMADNSLGRKLYRWMDKTNPRDEGDWTKVKASLQMGKPMP
jgi:hypothetical protein